MNRSSLLAIFALTLSASVWANEPPVKVNVAHLQPAVAREVEKHAAMGMTSLKRYLEATRKQNGLALEDVTRPEDRRDPKEITTSTQALTFVLPDDTKADDLARRVAPRPCIAGTPGRIAEQVAAYAAVGVDELIVPDFTLGTGEQRADALDAIIEQVAPAFRSA